MLYIIFYIVIKSLFVYSLILQTMWEALCKGISRFKLISNSKHISLFHVPIRIVIYLGSNLKNTKNIEAQQTLWCSYENDLSVKIVFLNKNLNCRPFKFTLSIPLSFLLECWAFRIYVLVTRHKLQC